MPQANNTENPIINMILSLEGQTLSSRQVYEALLERGFHGEKQSVINTLNTMRKQGLISVGHKGCAKVYTITPHGGQCCNNTAPYTANTEQSRFCFKATI